VMSCLRSSMHVALTAAYAVLLVLSLAAPVLAQTQQPPDILPVELRTPPADAERSDSGLVSLKLISGRMTEKASVSDVVTVTYSGWRDDGQLFDSSIPRGESVTFPLDGVMKGWQECVQLMTIGETRRCWIPENLAYQGQAGRPTGTVTFDITLIEARRSPLHPPPDLKAPPADAITTASGLAYKVLRQGTGVRNPTRISRVTVHYSGWTTNGRSFDSTIPRGVPATFGLGDVIAGWTEGLQLMVEGERVRFWIPEGLAYKGEGDGPRGMLVFEIDLIRIE
jgi:FKBP-type peptidyl-prolyl cis-trans isomerase